MPNWLFIIIFAIGVIVFLGYCLSQASGNKIGLKRAIFIVLLIGAILIIYTCKDDVKDGSAKTTTQQEIMFS